MCFAGSDQLKEKFKYCYSWILSGNCGQSILWNCFHLLDRKLRRPNLVTSCCAELILVTNRWIMDSYYVYYELNLFM